MKNSACTISNKNNSLLIMIHSNLMGEKTIRNKQSVQTTKITFRTRSISGCCSRSCTISAWPPLAAKCRGELSWPFSKFGLQFPFSSNSLVASTLPCLKGTTQMSNLTTTHHEQDKLKSKKIKKKTPMDTSDFLG